MIYAILFCGLKLIVFFASIDVFHQFVGVNETLSNHINVLEWKPKLWNRLKISWTYRIVLIFLCVWNKNLGQFNKTLWPVIIYVCKDHRLDKAKANRIQSDSLQIKVNITFIFLVFCCCCSGKTVKQEYKVVYSNLH